MTSYEHAPSLAHIIQREAQALINALIDGDDVDAATTLATIADPAGTHPSSTTTVRSPCPGRRASTTSSMKEHCRAAIDL